MVKTVLTKSQERKRVTIYKDENNKTVTLIVTISHDDRCGNGHNTFSMTAKCCVAQQTSYGCQHDEIAQRFPDLAPYIKWHLCSTDGPLHYIGNSLYWAGKSGWCGGKPNDPPNLDHFRSTAIWSEAGEEILELPDDWLVSKLENRLPALMVEFQEAVESLGLTY